MNELKVEWTGIRPLLMHNGNMADPRNKITRQIKEISSKTKKTTADYERMADLEWAGGIYWNEDVGVYIPNENIERCIQLGAQKSRLGKNVASAVFVKDVIVPLHFKDEGADFEDLKNNLDYRLEIGVRVKGSRLIRSRPKIEIPWSLKFTLEYDEAVIGRASLVRSMKDAGALIGLGDWKPKYGRFLVEVKGGDGDDE